MVRRGDDGRVERLVFEQLAVVVEVGRAAADLRLRGRQVRLVDVAEGRDLAVLVDEEGVEELVAAVADADEAEANLVVRAEDAGIRSGREGECGPAARVAFGPFGGAFADLAVLLKLTQGVCCGVPFPAQLRNPSGRHASQGTARLRVG